MRTILLVTEEYDPTADNLVQMLQRRGSPVLRWNMDRYPQGSCLTYDVSREAFDGTFTIYDRKIAFEEIGSAWYRAVGARGFPEGLSAAERDFATKESEMMFDSLAGVTDWRWINHPRPHREGGRKPAQLHLARRLGMDVPRTLMTNDPAAVTAFRDACDGAIIFKTFSQPFNLERGKVAYTGVVDDAAAARLYLIQHSPGIFQELIAKEYELRVTVVGERIFAARILSQANVETQIDWRKAPYDVRYDALTLPPQVESLILSFMKESGLAYSCLDFIVTPDGRHVFLESKPRGQYLWIEHFTGLPITEALAEALG